jgi:hypothetical protein
MQNQFDTANYPTTEPSELVSGSRWAWKKPDITGAYPTDAYTLKYRLVLQGSEPGLISITADKTGAEHVVELEASTTGSYAAGDYIWRSFIARDSDSAEVFISEGLLTVLPSLGMGADVRSHTLKVLQAIRATIEGTATNDQLKIEIAGRVIERRSISELMQLEREYSKRWAMERADINRKAGRPAKSRTLVKMGA